jgi:hypothetical protein
MIASGGAACALVNWRTHIDSYGIAKGRNLCPPEAKPNLLTYLSDPATLPHWRAAV